MTDLPRHFIVADLGFGDAGKGQTVDRLCRMQPVDMVVRYNGGCQAGHNVHLLDGREHTFSQFGSGTFAGAETHLSRFMMVEPYSLAIEATALSNQGIPDPMGTVTIERNALVTSPYHWIVNRARENALAKDRHGSCGRGIGATQEFAALRPNLALRVGDYQTPSVHLSKLTELRRWAEVMLHNLNPQGAATQPFLPKEADVARQQAEILAQTVVVDSSWLPKLMMDGAKTVMEGAQGVLLDQEFGFHPHTTWSDTTMRNADTLLAEAGQTGFRLGVLRTYMVRHGAGPLPTEVDLGLPEPDNATGPWQGSFRTGHFDATLYRYALSSLCVSAMRQSWIPPINKIDEYIDGLCLTHIDTAIEHDLRIVKEYRHEGSHWPFHPVEEPTLEGQEALALALTERKFDFAISGPVRQWTQRVEQELSLPIVMTGHGPTDYRIGKDPSAFAGRVQNDKTAYQFVFTADTN